MLNTVENWQVNRDNIEPDSLPLYDSLFSDLVDQIRSQGLNISMDLSDPEPADDGANEARELLDAMIEILRAVSPRSLEQVKQVLHHALRLREMVKEDN